MKVSIIMSAYNAEKTIKRAIDSVLKQSYANIELVIINDCSTDNTENLIKEYKSNKIKLINHEVNLGAGYTRDTGVKSCTGDYIKFLDSDDYLATDAISTYINNALVNNADIVVGGQIVEDSDCNILSIQVPPAFLVETGMDRFTPDKEQCKRFLNCFLIKKSLFDTIDYSHKRYCEDTPTLFKLVYLSKVIVTIPYAGYHYTQNNTSLVHTASIIKRKIYYVLAAIDNTLFLRDRGETMNNDLVLDNYKELKKYKKEELLAFPDEMNEIYSFLKANVK